jgi:hypothetical protein
MATPDPSHLHPFFWYRLGAAIAIAAVGLVLISSNEWRTCSDQVTNVGPTPTAQVCHKADPTDADVIAGFLVIFLLLWPELTEVGLPGGIVLKRQLKEQAATLADHERRQTELAHRLELLDVQQAVSARANSQSEVVQHFYAGGAPEARDAVRQQSRETADAPSPDARVDPERAALEAELLRLWERTIARWLEATDALVSSSPFLVTRARDTARELNLTDGDLAALLDYRQRYSRELDVVRAARNSVAHAKPIPIDDLRAAVEAARSLIALAPHGIARRPPAQDDDR